LINSNITVKIRRKKSHADHYYPKDMPQFAEMGTDINLARLPFIQ